MKRKHRKLFDKRTIIYNTNTTYIVDTLNIVQRGHNNKELYYYLGFFCNE